jgi:DNA-directed RNA polymerase specialized sigma subunit
MVAEFPPLGEQAIAGLLATVGYENLDQDPRRQLVQHHLWIALEQATSVDRPGTPVGDLFQEGTTALLKLVHGLSGETPLTPAEFQRQAREVVAAAIRATLAEEERAREQDERWARDAEVVFAADVEMRRELGAPPSDRQLADHLGWPEERVRQLRQAASEAAAQHDRELLETLEEMEED